MGHALLQLPMTAAEFLAWDETQTVKHEFLAGEIIGMVGATKAHVLLTTNVTMALRQHLRGTPCITFATDLKLRVESADAFFYPDVVVSCSAADREDPLIVREPVLLVEVLSPSTAGYDLGAKFAAYRQLPTLQEVLFVHPDSRRCDLFRKGPSSTDAALWVLHPFDPGQAVRLASVDLDLSHQVLWEDVPVAGAIKPT
jgi:Uma2 family endonuclease